MLVLTTFDLDEYVYAALRAGASGFLLKDARPDELLSAIRNVAAGDAVVAPSATRRLLDHVLPRAARRARQPPARTRGWRCSPRGRSRCWSRSPAGPPTPRSAARLYMAEGTVKTHIGRLLAKLAVRDRVGLVLFAYETGLAPR